MATVNKASLRTEFGALKARFEALCANGKMSPESRALFEAFLMLFELLMAVFLEKNTPKSSRNSGLPSSQTGADETARRPGAQGKGPKSRAAPNRVVAETRTAPVTECRACGRDLTFVEDAHGHAWAKRLKKLLLDTCRSVREHPDKALGEAACKAVRKRYRTLLTQAGRELPKPPKRLSGQRGRIARSDAENLHEALVKYETEVLRFARDPNVPFTNNRAERDIRMAKVKQKVSGCFRTPRYAAAYCRISSYLQSMAHQGYNPLTAIQIALNGKAATMIGNPTDQAPGGE